MSGECVVRERRLAMILRQQLVLLFIVQAVLLAVAAWRNAHQLNPDAVAYCRIAGYYAAGQWELAVSGYWGPLLSWLMVPLLKLGCAPLVAARIVMAASGMVFLAGAVCVFRAFRMPPVGLLAGSSIAAAWSVFWSVRNISPDLLMAGLAGLAIAATWEAFWSGRWSALIAAGAWWGTAYLAKAVALPWAGLVTAGFALLAAGARRALWREAGTGLGVVWLCVALVAGPWMGALSLHYGKFTFSTTGPIAHALAGPDKASRYHPAMVTLHEPDAGRVTQWEEPSQMAYRVWSPFADTQSLQHQLGVMQHNAGILIGWLLPVEAWLAQEELPGWRRWLGTFDFLGLAMIAPWLCLVSIVRQLDQPRRHRWCWALIPVATLAALYLPFFVMAEDNRYFYAAWPFLWVLTLNALPRGSRWRRAGFQLMLGSFAVPAALWCGAALRGLPNPAAEAARQLAVELKTAGHTGPLAGSGVLPGGRAGLYTAFLLSERWLGDEPDGEPDRYVAAGARVVVRGRESQPMTVAGFAQAAQWRELRRPESAPLRVFIRSDSR